MRAVVNHSEGVRGVAVRAQGRLSDAAAVDFHRRCERAHMAPEKGLAHLGDDVGRSDHHATDGDQLVNVWREGLGLLLAQYTTLLTHS